MTITEIAKRRFCPTACALLGTALGVLLGAYLLMKSISLLICVLIAVIASLVLAWALKKAFCRGGDVETADMNVATTAAPLAAVGAAAAVSETLTSAEPAAAVKAAPKKTAAKKPAAKKAPAKKPAAKKAAAKPPVLYTKRPSDVDDLKLISGVGPKLEKTCNEIGVYQFAQIANWKKADIATVDDKLSFKGRIERDEWVKQAKKLAKK